MNKVLFILLLGSFWVYSQQNSKITQLAKYAQKSYSDKNYAKAYQVYYYLVKLTYNTGQYKSALVYSQKCLDLFSKIPNLSPYKKANHYNIHGAILVKLTRYKPALENFQMALKKLQNLPAPTTKFFKIHYMRIYDCYNNIGAVYEAIGELTKALAYFQKSLDGQKKILTPPNIILSNSYNNVGNIYAAWGRYKEAYDHYKEALKQRLKIKPLPFLKISNSYNNMATVLELSGIVLAGANLFSKNKDNGILTASDISLLDLDGICCVVLSACSSMIGKYVDGAGLLSFKWAFEYAKVQTLIATLWQIQDRETQYLMSLFYHQNTKYPIAQALCRAQQKHIKGHRQSKSGLSHPYYWGAFICHGVSK